MPLLVGYSDTEAEATDAEQQPASTAALRTFAAPHRSDIPLQNRRTPAKKSTGQTQDDVVRDLLHGLIESVCGSGTSISVNSEPVNANDGFESEGFVFHRGGESQLSESDDDSVDGAKPKLIGLLPKAVIKHRPGSPSTSSSDEEDLETLQSRIQDRRSTKAYEPPRVKGELTVEDLPPIDRLQISVDPTVVLQKLGKVTSIVGGLVIIQSDMDVKPVNDDSLFFTEKRRAFGHVFELFGPVCRPMYSVRFNSATDLEDYGISLGTTVYYTPEIDEYTRPVFVHELRQQKYTDASWKDNVEAPSDEQEFSDDEQERAARRPTRRGRGRQTPANAIGNAEPRSAAKRKHNNNRRQQHNGGQFNGPPGPAAAAGPANCFYGQPQQPAWSNAQFPAPWGQAMPWAMMPNNHNGPPPPWAHGPPPPPYGPRGGGQGRGRGRGFRHGAPQQQNGTPPQGWQPPPFNNFTDTRNCNQ